MKTGLGVAIIGVTWIALAGGVVALSMHSTVVESSYSPPPYKPPETNYTVIPAMEIPPVRKVETAAEPTPAGPPPAYSTRTPIMTLLANPAARAIVYQDIPALANVSAAQLEMAGTMSLRVVQSMLPAILNNAVLDKLDQDLSKVPALPATPPPAPAVAATPAVAAADPAATLAPDVQPGALSSRTLLSTLLANPAARVVVMRELPALAQVPQAQLTMASAMSLRDIQRIMPAAVTDAALEKVDQGLAALPSSTAAAAPAAVPTAPAS